MPADQRDTITFDDTITRLKTHYDGGRNKTLLNYDYHKLTQKEGESFNSWGIRVKCEAAQCDFSCASPTCNVMDTLVRDQIIIGCTNTEIRKNALKNQWNLEDLMKNGRALEAATWGAQQIRQEGDPPRVARMKKPGKYPRKNKRKDKTQPTHQTAS